MAQTRKPAAKKTAARNAAPAKTTAPNRKANKWANVQLPEGFKPIVAGEYGEQWDHETNPILTGHVVGDVREVESGKGRNARTSRVVSIMSEDDGRLYDVWESANLRGWFDQVSEGLRVSVVFQGYRDVGKASPMKVMVGAIDEDEAEEAQEERKAPARKSGTKRR